MDKIITVILVNAVLGAEPEETFTVLNDVKDGVLRETFIQREVFEMYFAATGLEGGQYTQTKIQY